MIHAFILEQSPGSNSSCKIHGFENIHGIAAFVKPSVINIQLYVLAFLQSAIDGGERKRKRKKKRER